MGRLPTGHRKYQIQELWPVHKEISRRLLLGQKNVDIAKDLNISPVSVSIAKNSHIQQARFAELEARRDDSCIDVAKQIKQLSGIAIGVVEALMSNPDVKADVRLRAATDVLDRAGFAPVQKSQNTSVQLYCSADEIAKIKAQARACGIVREAPIVDVELAKAAPGIEVSAGGAGEAPEGSETDGFFG